VPIHAISFIITANKEDSTAGVGDGVKLGDGVGVVEGNGEGEDKIVGIGVIVGEKEGRGEGFSVGLKIIVGVGDNNGDNGDDTNLIGVGDGVFIGDTLVTLDVLGDDTNSVTNFFVSLEDSLFVAVKTAFMYENPYPKADSP